MTQVDTIINKAKSLLGSHAYDHYCEKFVMICYNAAGITGTRAASARAACGMWKVSGSKTNIPRGATVYFFNSKYGHVGIYLGGGQMIHAWGDAGVITSSIDICSNYQGWGWECGIRPTGTDVTETADNSAESGTSASSKSKKAKEMTKTVVKSITGGEGVYKFQNLLNAQSGDAWCELLIENDKIYSPVLTGDIKLTYERKNAPGKLEFSVIKDEALNFQEGNPVRLRVSGENVFYGYVFTKKRADNVTINVTAYDQLRYLKNKDSYIYENKKYSDLLRMIAADYKLKVGEIADTGYVIPQRVEDGTLFDILGNASDLTVIRTGKLFVLYDDFGKLTLKNVDDMFLNVYIDEEQFQKFSYETSIDKDVYNKVKIAVDNEDTGEREFYIFNDEENQSSWGVLQDYEEMDFGNTTGDIRVKGQALLRYYNVKSRKLTIEGVFGVIGVRGGNSVLVKLNVGDMIVSNRMLIEKVEHTFSGGHHFMTLNLSGIGGEFS